METRTLKLRDGTEMEISCDERLLSVVRQVLRLSPDTVPTDQEIATVILTLTKDSIDKQYPQED